MTRDHFLLSTRPPPIRGLVLSVVSIKAFRMEERKAFISKVVEYKVQPKLT